MTQHRLSGLAPASLAAYLASLGLFRAISSQVDPRARAAWRGDAFWIETELDHLTDWLVEDFRPAPILSPWNGGSGFGAKDKLSRQVLAKIDQCEADRLADFRGGYRTARRVAAEAQAHSWDKARLVAELRNRCPDTMLGWLDASVVLLPEGAAYPPLLGTGGNDGRLDFSTNYHQRLLDVVPELGADPRRSRGWVEDLLHGGSTTPLVAGAVGQFDPAAAGGRNSSPFGAADSLVNPWAFVLLIEGSLYFAAGITRRRGTEHGRAAMPFCVFASPDGPLPGTEGEQSRGELWAPVWTRATSARVIEQLFTESRASWQGRTASQAGQMYAAVRSYGVSSGIDRFIRFGLHQRNGLAFSAVRLDEVDVRADPRITLTVEPDRCMSRLGRSSAIAVQQARRRFDRAHIAFARRLQPRDLRDMLAETTLAELATLRSTTARNNLGQRPPYPRAEEFARFLAYELPHRAEFRVAACLASAGYPDAATGTVVPLREVLVGRLPMRSTEGFREPSVRGLGDRPLPSVLADAVVWRAQQGGDPGDVERGFQPFPITRIRTGWEDLHAWVSGGLDDAEVFRSFLACLAMDWRRVAPPWARDASQETSTTPVPELAILQGFACGQLTTTTERSAELTGANAPRIGYGLLRDWPSRVLAGKRQGVLDQAAAVLQRLGWHTYPPRVSPVAAPRVLAALVARGSLRPLRQIGATSPDRVDEDRALSDLLSSIADLDDQEPDHAQ